MTKLITRNRTVIGEGIEASTIDEACQATDTGACAACSRKAVVHVATQHGTRRYCLAHARRYEEKRGGAA